jgi:YfiH family protein
MEGPILLAETWVWRDRHAGVEVLFTGRGPEHPTEREEILHRLIPGAPPVAWAKQIHSTRALPAVAGACGEGDALFTNEDGIALSVITADCVPILLASPDRLAAVHAGWRGIAGRIVAATLEKAGGPPESWIAWIGPAIGPCCYEVGDDVAEQIAAASTLEVVLSGPAGKPHLDLQLAVQRQLEAAGVHEVITVRACTRCDSERLWSYRREGRQAGRNVGFIWQGSTAIK